MRPHLRRTRNSCGLLRGLPNRYSSNYGWYLADGLGWWSRNRSDRSCASLSDEENSRKLLDCLRENSQLRVYIFFGKILPLKQKYPTVSVIYVALNIVEIFFFSCSIVKLHSCFFLLFITPHSRRMLFFLYFLTSF